jgi:hypothetical protein
VRGREKKHDRKRKREKEGKLIQYSPMKHSKNKNVF